jgi:hypothetical protein
MRNSQLFKFDKLICSTNLFSSNFTQITSVVGTPKYIIIKNILLAVLEISNKHNTVFGSASMDYVVSIVQDQWH